MSNPPPPSLLTVAAVQVVITLIVQWAMRRFSPELKRLRDSAAEAERKYRETVAANHELARNTDREIQELTKVLAYFANPEVYRDWNVNGQAMRIPVLLNGKAIADRALAARRKPS